MPKGMRWVVAGIVAVALAVVIAWALLVPAADWLARHDVGSLTGTSLGTARTNARGSLLTLAAGLVAVGALVFTARNLSLSRRTFELTEQGQVTDRYTKAIEQLGSEKIDVRIGSIYALERIARDSDRDHPTVMEVLTAFIREHSREPWPAPGPRTETVQRSTRPDVEAAIAVIGRRVVDRDIRRVNLRAADLTGADLNGADLSGADLADANLTAADLRGADLADADLTDANLSFANLSGANLTAANLSHADLSGSELTDAVLLTASIEGANLEGASLEGTNLVRAQLFGSDLTGAKLKDADLAAAGLRRANFTRAFLTGANLRGADPTGANLSGTYLVGADLTGAISPTQVPEGWLKDSSTDKLSRAPHV